MSDERINKRIALLCGWKRDSQNGFQPTWKNTDGTRYAESLLPNYTSDLNACHEFEKTLTDEQFDAFQIELSRVVFKHLCVVTYPVGFKQRSFWNATARQRCEAFLRVQGKWEEEA